MLDIGDDLRVFHIGFQKSSWQIWLPVFLSFVSITYGSSQGTSSLSSMDILHSSTETVNQTHSINVSEVFTSMTISASHTVQMNSTVIVNESVSSSMATPLPSNCYHVCLCNHSRMVNSTVSMAYNMTQSATRRLEMTASLNMTSSPNVVIMPHSSSNGSMPYTASITATPVSNNSSVENTMSANATAMNYNSSVWPTASPSISAPFVCSMANCWVKVECRTRSLHTPMTPYTAAISPSLSSTGHVPVSSSVAPTQPACQAAVDCNGVCGGGAYFDCDVCIEGNTNVSSFRDCENVCNGTAVNSSCGVCLRPGARDPLLDCNHTCRGTAKRDQCGVCTGGNTGLMANYLKDACGVCNGTNSTCIGCDGVPNSGKVNDACQICDGNGSTCTDIMKTEPRTIASCRPSVLVFGAGLNGGDETVCELYDKDNGQLVVNTTATSRNLTHALCNFSSWVNYTASVYNLSVTVVHNDKSNVKTNTSLQVYYYSCPNLTLTSASPSDVLIDELPRYVNLSGSGFFDWVETVCYFGSQSTTDVAFVDANNLRCKISAVDTSTLFSLSLSMDGGLKRVGYVNLTVFARAPNVTAAKFSKTAAEILVSFEKEVEFDGEETCAAFFDSATVTKLGESPKCRLRTTQELEILLGSGATILVGDNLAFKNNVFKTRGELYSKYLTNGSSTVSSPDSPLTPEPVITGPETLSSCGNLTLSGFQSIGGGGRPLNFTWSLKSPSSGANVTDINTILSGLGTDADRIHIPGTILGAGKTYVFQLGVANFLNPSSFQNVTHSVVKAADPVPFLSLSSSIDLDEGEVYVSEDLSIKVTAVVAPCVNDTKVNFLWTVSCPVPQAQQKVEGSSSFQSTSTKATLSITKGVLTGDVTCKFNVTGSMNYNVIVKSSVAVDVKALPTPLEPAIAGGDRQIGDGSGTITLDAETQTVDPDNSNHPLICKWGCRDENDGSCFSAAQIGTLIFSLVSGCKLSLQSNHFAAGKTYTISVEVTKGTRKASASILLTVVEGNPPDVWVGEAKKKIVAGDRVTLEGYFKTTVQPAKVEWSCVREQGFAFVDLSNLTLIEEYIAADDSYAFLNVPAGLLNKGSKYRFKLTVNDGSKDGVATMVVEVRSGPTSGSLSVDKNTVQALFDEVTLSATQWTVDKDATPLRYAFGEVVRGDVCTPWAPPSKNLEWKGIMSAGSGPNNILTLCVIVEDKFQSSAMAKVNITSNPPALSPDAVDDLLSSAVEAQLRSGNADRALSAMSSIADTVQSSSNASAELKRNISQKAQDFILEYLDSAVVGKDNAVPLFTALVKTNATATRSSSNMAGAAVKILAGLGDKSLNDDQAEDFLKWMGDLAGESFEDDDDSFLESVVNVFDELGDNLAAELVLGDPPRVVSDDRLGVVNVRVSNLKQEIAISSEAGAPKFDPGAALSQQFGTPRQCGGGKPCSGVILKLVQYKKNLIKEDPNKQNQDVEIYSSQVVGLELGDPVDKKKLTVQNLAQPLKFTFVIGTVPDNKEAACKFFNETTKAWVSTGLTATGPVNGKLTCESTHATFFAPSQDTKANETTPASNATTTASPITTVGAKPAEEKDYTGAIVGGVIGGVVLIIIVVVGVWYCSKKKKEHTGRVSPEGPPEEQA